MRHPFSNISCLMAGGRRVDSRKQTSSVLATVRLHHMQLLRCIFGMSRKLKKEATERTGPMSEEIKARFASLPGSKSEIEDMIARSKDEIDSIELANPGALDEYNKRKREIGKLRKVLQEQSEDVRVRKAAIDDKMVSPPETLVMGQTRRHDAFGAPSSLCV